MGQTEAQFDPGSNEEMMLSLQQWSNLRPWAAGPQPLQQESESAQAQVIEVTCTKHTQTLKFPAWWAP